MGRIRGPQGCAINIHARPRKIVGRTIAHFRRTVVASQQIIAGVLRAYSAMGGQVQSRLPVCSSRATREIDSGEALAMQGRAFQHVGNDTGIRVRFADAFRDGGQGRGSSTTAERQVRLAGRAGPRRR
jgi:hypothetical protein